MADHTTLSRRGFLGGTAAACAVPSTGSAQGSMTPGAEGPRPGELVAENIGLITAWRADLTAEENEARHRALVAGFGSLEVRGRYGRSTAPAVDVRGIWAAGWIEDSGNLKGRLRKAGRLNGISAFVLKGYHRPAVLHALLDRPEIGLTAGDTLDLGPFRAECLGAYLTLLAGVTPRPARFADLAPDVTRLDPGGGRWEEVGYRVSPTGFNHGRFTSFDAEGRRQERIDGLSGYAQLARQIAQARVQNA